MSRASLIRAASLALVGLVLVSHGTTRVAAQELPAQITADPADCTIEPRAFDEIGALLDGTPVSEAVPAVTEVTIPIGSSISDSGTLNGVSATITGVFACLNAGDFGRTFAYLTDHAILTAFPWAVQAIATDEPYVTAEPQALPAEAWMTLLALGPVMRLADGRVGTLITFHDPSTESVTKIAALYLILTLRGPIWQIDEVLPIQE